MGRHSADLPIYGEMVDKARRAGTTAPDGTDEAMTWAADARGRVSYGGVTDYGPPSPTVFEHPDGSRYERISPDELGGP